MDVMNHAPTCMVYLFELSKDIASGRREEKNREEKGRERLMGSGEGPEYQYDTKEE